MEQLSQKSGINRLREKPFSDMSVFHVLKFRFSNTISDDLVVPKGKM